MKRLALAAALLLTFPLLPQNVEIPRTGESIEVSIVNVDVVVTDKQGNRIHGLGRDDFEIYENGERQAVTNFAEYTPSTEGRVTATTEAAPKPAEVAPHEPRTLVLFVERMVMPEFRRHALYDGLRKLVRETVRPGDNVTIVSWNRMLITRQPFTDDVAAIERTLTTMEKESASPHSDEHADIESEREWYQQVMNIAPAGYYDIDTSELVPPSGVAAAMHAKLEQKAKIRSVKSLLTAMSGFRGRKAMVLVLYRLNRYAGQEFLTAPGTGASAVKQSMRDFDMLDELETIPKTANANGVTLYPLFGPGLATDVFPRVDIPQMNAPSAADAQFLVFNQMAILNDLADQTGGLTTYGTENIVELLPRIASDFDDYYSLAYNATHRRKDAARKIAVKVKNPAYQVRTRDNYVDKSEETQMRDRIVASLFKDDPGSLLRFAVIRGKAVQKSKNRYLVPLTIRIPVGALTALPKTGKREGAFSVYAGWGGILGEMSDVSKETRPFSFAEKDLERSKRSYFTYELPVVIDEKTDRVVVGVVDEVGKDYGIARVMLPSRAKMLEEGKKP